MQAGKDVYVEKPLSHNVREGRQLVKAARKYKRMCQHGTQGAVAPAIEEAMQKLRDGVIGKVYMARALCYKWRPSIGKADGPQPVRGRRLRLWLGPAPRKPLLRKKLHYDWHWFWDYGNATSATRASTRWTWPAGAWASVCRERCSRWAVGSSSTTTKEVFNVQTTSFFYPEQKQDARLRGRPG